MTAKKQFIQLMLKHLPPSASELHLLDIGAVSGDILQEARPELQVKPASVRVADWTVADASLDAIVAYDQHLSHELLGASLRALRHGGRLIVVNPLASFDTGFGLLLEQAGFVRILVEPAMDAQGVLIRGERPHNTESTPERVKIGAQRDADGLDWSTYRGRFVYLLIRQSPNKPIWRLTDDDVITWHTVVANGQALAFTSLPKAVQFMQGAVLANQIRDINKVAKFKKELAQEWHFGVRLNPTLSDIEHASRDWLMIDPNSAETPDE